VLIRHREAADTVRLAALHPGAVDASRATLKPEIPPTGAYGIPLRDELVLTRSLDG